MEFCLMVVAFHVGSLYYSTECFPTEVERRAYVKGRLKNKNDQFLALYCNSEELKENYAIILNEGYQVGIRSD